MFDDFTFLLIKIDSQFTFAIVSSVSEEVCRIFLYSRNSNPALRRPPTTVHNYTMQMQFFRNYYNDHGHSKFSKMRGRSSVDHFFNILMSYSTVALVLPISTVVSGVV